MFALSCKHPITEPSNSVVDTFVVAANGQASLLTTAQLCVVLWLVCRYVRRRIRVQRVRFSILLLLRI